MFSDELTIHPVILSGGSGFGCGPAGGPRKQFIEFQERIFSFRTMVIPLVIRPIIFYVAGKYQNHLYS